MRRLMAAALVWLALMTGMVLAEESGLSINAPREEIRPGRSAILSFMVPEDGICTISLTNETGDISLVVSQERKVTAGYNAMYWNGTCNGALVPPGDWKLVIRMNDMAAETPVTVGAVAPCLYFADAESASVREGDPVRVSFYATEAGTLVLTEKETETLLHREAVPAGNQEISFRAEMEPGRREVVLTLEGEDGTRSDPVSISLEVAVNPFRSGMMPEYLLEKAENGFVPAQTSPYRGEDRTLNYWTLPMDISDEEAVWYVLTSPVTVLDNGRKNAEKMQVVIRSGPSEESSGVGMATCVSQGVHVLERGEEWSLIECYSSSFHDSTILNWNALVQGYVPTAYLKEVVPNQEMGLVVDKLTQRLYIFREGKLFSTLLVSTGKANAKQPYNETRSGEFLLVSKVGEFASDNMRCALALRFNDGDLLHEVPYISGTDGYKNYSITEPKLGTKASHGCIRVQRQASPEGANQKWLWNNYRKNTKILIWEDWQGRQIRTPDSETVLYCLKKRTGYYHTADQCSEIRNRKAETLTYGQLEEAEYRKLKPCPLCAAPGRADTIREINETYAAGGDHEPVLSEALKSCPKKLKGK